VSGLAMLWKFSKMPSFVLTLFTGYCSLAE
jgi:hypothetical protein